MNNIGGSKLTDCTSLSSTACLCANKDTLLSLSDATKAACSGSSFGMFTVFPPHGPIDAASELILIL